MNCDYWFRGSHSISSLQFQNLHLWTQYWPYRMAQ